MEMHKCFIFRHRFFVQPRIKLQKPVKIRLFANFKIGWLLWVEVLESNMPGDKHKEVDNFQILCVGLVFLGFHVRLNLKLCSERLISISNSFTSGSTQEVSQNVRRHVIKSANSCDRSEQKSLRMRLHDIHIYVPFPAFSRTTSKWKNLSAGLELILYAISDYQLLKISIIWCNI